MQLKTLITAAAVASLSSAQQTPNLTAALNSTQELSILNGLLGQNPDLVARLANASNITIFAPSNSALQPLAQNEEYTALAAMPGYIAAFLSYHVFNGTVYAANISETPMFPHSLLMNETFTNVTGGQVAGVRARDDTVTVSSGLGFTANVTTADVNITNGVVHIVDNILYIPPNASTVALAADLTALAGALEATNLTDTIDSATDITIFAPANEAFEAIGSALSTLTAEQAAAILQYHVVNGTVAYSSLLSNGTSVNSSSGQPLNITIDDGEVFVNQARVIAADVLLANGVLHVIDSVLNPNSTIAANPDEDNPVVAYSGASSGMVPYTSGIPTATSMIVTTTDAVADGYTAAPTDALSSASQSAADATSSAGAAQVTGAIGAAALFGGAAYLAAQM
ncbi:Fasciclin-like arabinogalactan protein [Pseudocercospora fuligena]|uniref:Fasciclin-like arabinogalactan protein n=1 Tax=Pseudocercospora fuligena TaxID=685502 RepID=A0A8H6VHN9_9PEZI|nr:Fasciclin-like arabinogalactan protein [Pseudocercospora fuligena]